MERIAEEINKLKEKDQFRTIPDILSKSGDKIFLNGSEYVNFASNDYLAISTNRELRKEFLSQNKSLMSSASARLLSGSSYEYKELENTVAKLTGKERALIFNTGYQANLGIISCLVEKGDVVFSDKLNHASIIDGMKLANGDFYRYPHLDWQTLDRLLAAKRSEYNRALIVSESVFSMDGDVADIDKLVELKKKYNCILMIDEAHAFCAYGNTMGGVAYGKDVDIITATFGKAVGSFGAFCASGENMIEYLINKARSFIFSTSIPPINVAWSNWLLTEKFHYLKEQKMRLGLLVNDVHSFMNENGLKTPSTTHIVPIITGHNEETVKISEQLLSAGYYIPAIRPPTVQEGSARLRISLTADYTLDDFIEILKVIF